MLYICVFLIKTTNELTNRLLKYALSYGVSGILIFFCGINSLISIPSPTTVKNNYIAEKLQTKKVSSKTIIIPKSKFLKYSNITNTLTYVDSSNTIQNRQIHVSSYKLIEKSNSPKIEFHENIYSYKASQRDINNFIVTKSDNTSAINNAKPQNYFDSKTQTWHQISDITMYVSKYDYDKYSN